MVVDRAAFYGSRHTRDQHRDMRLDIDNMTYEVSIIFSAIVLFPSLFTGEVLIIYGKWWLPNNLGNVWSMQELLALGDRIGNVNTGLSEDSISKCLSEAIYCSADQNQEGSCAICLVGT